MDKKELIVLDATVTDLLNARAFRAELCNGHRLVAVADGLAARSYVRGERVKVAMSPFDMSVGRVIILDERNEL